MKIMTPCDLYLIELVILVHFPMTLTSGPDILVPRPDYVGVNIKLLTIIDS